jgi:hypothetical protein
MVHFNKLDIVHGTWIHLLGGTRPALPSACPISHLLSWWTLFAMNTLCLSAMHPPHNLLWVCIVILYRRASFFSSVSLSGL